MTGYWILGLSIFLQLMAAGLTLRLVRVTGRTITWLLIAGSLLLMAIRRAVVLYHLVATDNSQPIDVQAELVALLISVLMLGGVILIRPYVISLKNSAAAVRESEAIYRGILENMVDTYYRTDKNGLITMLSPSVIELLGYSPDELLGKPSEFVYVDSSARQSLLDILSKHGSAKELEALLRHKDGRHILVETSANLLMDSDGNVLGTEGIIRNITRRRQTELINARMGRIVEDSSNEIYVFDSNTLKFILVNYGARSNLGYSMDELARLTPVDLKPEFSSQQFSELVQPLRDGLLMTVSLRTIHQRKNGTTYPVEVGIQLSLSETPPVFFAIIQDISERLKAESELIQAQKMEAVGQLTGGLAHDFNNLLTVIMGNLELALSESKLTSELKDFLDSSFHAAQRGAMLTQRLLAFSRKQMLQPEVVDLRTLVKKTEELLRRTLRENIDIEIIAGARLWRCEVDPGQLENALLNLAINASDAMPDGGKLTIETSNAYLDEQFVSSHFDVVAGQYVLLAVSDNGSGMSKEVLGQVFEPFFTTKSAGSGLGLSMVYGLVRQSGGSIDVYSEPDEGTTIKIYLPRVSGQIESELDATLISLDANANNETILVVEDDENLRRLTVRMLERIGYAAISATDAQSALLALKDSGGIDLLLTDIILPGSMNGALLAKEVARRWPETRVLYMSGYTENAIIHDGKLDAGLQLLQKPFTISQLATKTHRALTA